MKMDGEEVELDWDSEYFDDCLKRAGPMRLGYWTPFSTLAWAISRDESFVAGVQLFETEQSSNSGGIESVAAWMTIGNAAGERFGITLEGAIISLREALEEGLIPDAIATDRMSGEAENIPKHLWTRWKLGHPNCGLQLVPGFFDFQFSSAEVRQAFPLGAGTEVSTGMAVAQIMVPTLPEGATPNDHKHADFAHQAAKIIRDDLSIKRETAFRQVAPQEHMRSEATICRAIRSAFQKMYRPDGRPHQN